MSVAVAVAPRAVFGAFGACQVSVTIVAYAPQFYTTTNPTHTQVLRLRFVPEGDEEDDVDIDFLKSVEEQIRTKLKVRVRVHVIGEGDWFMSHHWAHRSIERAIDTHPS